MSDGISIALRGVDDLKRALEAASAAIRKKAVRGALRKAGQVIASEARQLAPVLAVPAPFRKAGTVRRAITVRGSKFARQEGNEGVFIGVRALRGARQKKLGKAGARNPNDPFYWWFLEFGTKRMPARPFLRTAVQKKGDEAVRAFMQSVVPQIERLDKKGM